MLALSAATRREREVRDAEPATAGRKG